MITKIIILGDDEKLPDGCYRGFYPDDPKRKAALERAKIGYQLSDRNTVVMVPVEERKDA